jgi:predicted alpha/beta superfamily hydrolase
MSWARTTEARHAGIKNQRRRRRGSRYHDPTIRMEAGMGRRFSLLWWWLLVMCMCAPAWAQQGAPRKFVLENTQIVPVQSKATGKAHELVVILPASYAANPGKTYPVLYFLDAYWDTPLLSATYGNLIYDNQVPEFIMVGLSYPSGANYDLERRRDFTITSIDPDSGKADAFLAFLTTEVAPLVESRFRAEKTGRVIAGSSLGGLFALATAYKAPGFFAGHIAISPAAGWDHDALARLDAQWAQEHKALAARVFVSYGGAEYPAFREPIAALQRQLAGRRYQGMSLMNHMMQGLDHASVKGAGYVRALMWIWQPYKPPGPSGLTRAMTAQGE